MHKLCEYIDDELMELENKVDKTGKLSNAEVEYGKELAKFKTALLTNAAMEDEGYSGRYWDGRYYYDGEPGMDGTMNRDGRMSNARGRGSRAKRDAMGRYSSRGYSRADAKEDMIDELEELMEKAPDEHTRKKFERFIAEMK